MVMTWLLSLALLSPSDVTYKFDRFRDTTSVVLTTNVTEALRLQLLYAYAGQTPPRKIADLVALFSATSKSWQYLNYSSLILLVDGKPMELPTDHDGTVGSGYVLEQISAPLTAKQVKALAVARVVEGRLGITEFKLSDEQLAAVRAYVDSLTKPIPSETTAP